MLVDQLMNLVTGGSPGPPTRQFIAQCMAPLFSVGDTFLLFDTINKCNDILKMKDDSPTYLPCRLAATVVVGTMYQRLGRMMGRSYEETVSILNKGLKSAESSTRAETMITFGKVCRGLGGAASNVHKDIYKACRASLTDRVMSVRSAAAECLVEMMDCAPFLYTAELENMASLCFRAFDGCNYSTRMSVAKLLGMLMAQTQEQEKNRKQPMIGINKKERGQVAGNVDGSDPRTGEEQEAANDWKQQECQHQVYVIRGCPRSLGSRLPERRCWKLPQGNRRPYEEQCCQSRSEGWGQSRLCHHDQVSGTCLS